MNFQILDNENDILTLLRYHNDNSDFVVIDLETTSVDARSCELVDIQLSGRDSNSAVLLSSKFSHLLTNISSRITLVGHNIKYDLHVLYRHGVDLLSYSFHDTMLIGHLLDENRESYSLDSYVKEYWNDHYKEEFWKKYKTYEEAPLEERLSYACKDVIYTGLIYQTHISPIRLDSPFYHLITHVSRLQKVLLKTEIKGIAIDLDYLTNVGIKIKTRIDELLPEMRSLVQEEVEFLETEKWSYEIDKRKTDKGKAGVPRPIFSFDSSKQLCGLLYDVLSLPKQVNDKTKATSVDDASLEKIRDCHPIISLIQEYRGHHKVYGAYIEGTLERMKNGRIYPEFRVNGTVTGRISHSNPNLGQLPRNGGIRGIYTPNMGDVFISADYSQLEVCIEANLTNDSSLKRIFTEGLSKHDITAKELGVTRDQAKTLNFALQYWCSHYKVAKLLKVTEREAYEIWQKYWDIYKGPKALKDRTDKLVDNGDDLVTAFGRRRRFQIRKRSSWDGDYRQAYNFLIQGTGADITSRAYYLISEWLENKQIGRGIFTVHDEIIIQVKEKHAKEAEDQLLRVMCAIGDEIGFEIPLKATSSGPMYRWED